MKTILAALTLTGAVALPAPAQPPPTDLPPGKPEILGTIATTPAPLLPANYKLLYEQPFKSAAALKDFVFSDPKAWRWSAETNGGALELFGKSAYQPKDRSPFNIALVADRTFGDFTLDVEMQSTIKPYGHQDLCLFYGFEATNKFYYTHLAVAADPHAHNIFVVNNQPRTAIAKATTKGVTWGEGEWHKVRIERRLGAGSIKVYFDDLTKPLMVAEDKTCGAGLIGVGSFDDKGKVRNLRIYGPAMEAKPTTIFRRGEAPQP